MNLEHHPFLQCRLHLTEVKDLVKIIMKGFIFGFGANEVKIDKIRKKTHYMFCMNSVHGVTTVCTIYSSQISGLMSGRVRKNVTK